MRLAEALVLRADRQKRIAQLKERLLNNSLVQEGDEPAENPADLFRELESLATDLQRLIRAINNTNSVTRMEDGTTLTDALAARDVFAIRQAIYREVAGSAYYRRRGPRYSGSEVRWVRTIDVSRTQQLADDIARQYRELDSAIQATNWNTDLIE